MRAGRPFVDQRVVDLDRALGVATTASIRWDLPRPELLRHGMNAIYACGDVVVRVGRATSPASSAHELTVVLRSAGVPVVPPIDGLTADLDGFAVSAWQRIRPIDTPVDWQAVGAAIARIHRLDPGAVPTRYPVPSPSSFPWWDFDTLLDSVAVHIDSVALTGLRETIEQHRSWVDDIDDGAVICHGDVHPGNVLMTVAGPVLIDFDLLCSAPPAWDHAMLTTYADRWGGDPVVYAAFADGYGVSMAGEPLTATIADLRNVAATLMRVRAGISDPAARSEAERRLRYWRGDLDAPQWRAQ